MRIKITKGQLSVLIILSVLVIDQIIKVLVKTGMHLHENIRVCGNWFYIYFTENNGMAFGMEIFGKLFLTSFRIIAVALIGYYIVKVIKKNVKTGYVVCLSMILAGALGNILDSIFYGVLFSASYPANYINSSLATFMPDGGGYSTWLYGKVVDMFYFPIIDTTWPSWMPFIGGDHFIFFSPIFNFADASISCGIIALLLFYSNYLNEGHRTKKEVINKDEEQTK
ncbi:lipoprotein signal peptidase [uncultured Bacteroides sp.]|uniref:lipoprotein signal peptidase n=1 Tax=uncultured Bacteroides sp. TaxID=162156 RepID=UPI002AAAFE22|nr:lipoprotein signal peptidase [uncultured Bacteroides sp.]